MTSDTSKVIAISILVLAGLVYLFSGTSKGTILPPPPGGTELLEAFKQTDNPLEAKSDALALSSLCDAISDIIEYDTNLENPKLLTGIQLDRLRRWAREYLLEGASLGAKYPKLPEVVKEFLEKRIETEAGPLTKEQKLKWVEAFRELAQAANYAAERL